MEGDFIFVSIDPIFNIALKVLKKSNEQRRLLVTDAQSARLPGIRSNDNAPENIFRFGGQYNGREWIAARAFGQAASSVFRMVMLRAAGIDDEHWPVLGQNIMVRNQGALQFAVLMRQAHDEFHLANDRNAAERYWSRYDQLFSPSLIADKVLNGQGDMVPFNNMMLIFRYNFTKVIEITTNAHATMWAENDEGHEFDSYANVPCIRQEIKQGKDSEFFRFLRSCLAVETACYTEKVLKLFPGQAKAEDKHKNKGKDKDQGTGKGKDEDQGINKDKSKDKPEESRQQALNDLLCENLTIRE